MIDPKSVAAVIVTRGNVDFSQILDSLEPFGEVRIWDNSIQPDFKVFGRYMGVARSHFKVAAVFDDDVLLDRPVDLCLHYEPGIVVANMPLDYRRNYAYPEGIQLVGFGAIFDAECIKVLDQFEHDALFMRECDRAFTAMNTCKLVDLPIRHLPHAHGKDRLFQQPEHGAAMADIRRRIRDAKQM